MCSTIRGGNDAWEEVIVESVEEYGIVMRQSALAVAQQISEHRAVPMVQLV